MILDRFMTIFQTVQPEVALKVCKNFCLNYISNEFVGR